jgi:formate--tetrahydrofolate ligase
MKTDIEIAQSIRLEHIHTIADKLGIPESRFEPYGRYKAKLPIDLIDQSVVGQKKLILVTAVNPTPAGEGKTTMSIGLTDGLNLYGKKTCAVLREPSLGPVFGLKGGATGGGYAQIVPMEDINLHFNGDFAAVEKAHNLLAAILDNYLHFGHSNPRLDPRSIRWKRVMDVNDRSLRRLVCGLGGSTEGIPRETGFDITAASEIMAILCLSQSRSELKKRLGDILVGFTPEKTPVYARELRAVGAMAALLKDAIHPNLVQTLAGNPAIVHGGPFANIAQGTNTVLATQMGLTFSDYVVTEAGFGADLGAEKFLHIKCRSAGLSPATVVLVATVRALKYHGGQPLAHLTTSNLTALENGFLHLDRHLKNIQKFGLKTVVGVNQFVSDSPEELQAIMSHCTDRGIPCAIANVWAEGGNGALELARLVAQAAESETPQFQPLYELQASIPDKIDVLARSIYGAEGVDYTPQAQNDLKLIERIGFTGVPVCMAKTQKSFSDNEKLIGCPEGFRLTVRQIEIAAGAGFVVPITGTLMRMPGLPARPAAELIDIDDHGTITGLS